MTEETSKIRKVLQNEIAQLISVAVVVYSFVAFVILPIKSIQQDIDNIKNNHLHTIELSMTEMKTLNEQNVKDNDDAHSKIAELLTKTATILDEHIKNSR